MAKSSAAKIRANVAYNRRMDSIMIRPDKETGASIRAAAAAAGKPVQRYIIDLVTAQPEVLEDGDSVTVKAGPRTVEALERIAKPGETPQQCLARILADAIRREQSGK